MIERSIILDVDTIRSLLEYGNTRGTRQLRRVIDPPTARDVVTFQRIVDSTDEMTIGAWASVDLCGAGLGYPRIRCPYGEEGDQLWVREPWLKDWHGLHTRWADYDSENKQMLDGTPVDLERGIASGAYWRMEPEDMPRQYARLTLQIEKVYPDRLQNMTLGEISMSGCWPDRPADDKIWLVEAESIVASGYQWFIRQWDDLYEPDWVANPWVWVIEYKRFHG